MTGGLAGRGAITIWQDVRPEAREDFFARHNGEHIARTRLCVLAYKRKKDPRGSFLTFTGSSFTFVPVLLVVDQVTG